MRKFLSIIFFISSTAVFGNPVLAEESRLPNIVVILADDAGWGDFSCVGNKTISTPTRENRHGLVNEGMKKDV